MTILPCLGALAIAGGGLTLDVKTPQKTVLVGEAVKLDVTWGSSRDTEVFVEDENSGFNFLQFWIDDGGGARRYRETVRAVTEQVFAPRKLNRGSEISETIVLLHGSYNGAGRPDFIFPRAGRYSLRLVYNDPARKLRCESDGLTFTVNAPTGKDREVLELLRRDPELSLPITEAAKLLESHRGSPYLRLLKMRRQWEVAMELLNRRDPDTGDSLWHLDQQAFEAYRKNRLRKMAEDLLAEGDWGPFEPERLELIAHHAESGGDPETATNVKKQLAERFPGSRAAKHVKERETRDAETDVEEQQLKKQLHEDEKQKPPHPKQ